jgi:uncharacterized membrane protein
MSKPYFYIIEHIPSSKYYAGVRFAKNCSKDELLQEDGYQTSSKVVKDIINTEGLNSFKIRKIKEFDNKFDAMEYEAKFLHKVNAMYNDRFLNLNNTASFNYNTKKLCEYYNVEYVSQIPYIKEKVKETNLERYGVEYYTQTSEYLEKRKNTNLEKYGVEHNLQSEEIMKKVKETNLERYGVENAMHSNKIKNKIKRTNLERYGVENPFQNKDIIEKIKEKVKETNLERYGVEYSLSSKMVQEKIKNTVKDRYGVDNVFQTQEVKDKIYKTNLERYGYKYSSQNPEIKKKMIEKQFGKNNINFKGYYITPHGKFESVNHINMADKELLLTKNMIKWCRNPNKIISIISYKKSEYLKKNFKQADIVGIKTFKDIGFDFEAVEK